MCGFLRSKKSIWLSESLHFANKTWALRRKRKCAQTNRVLSVQQKTVRSRSSTCGPREISTSFPVNSHFFTHWWKVSNHEVSLLHIISLVFVAFTEICRIKLVFGGMPLVYRHKASAFPFSCMHWQRVVFGKAWLCDWFSTCLNLVTPSRFCSGL